MGDPKRFASKLAGYVVRFEKRFDLGFHELTLYGRDDHVFVWGAHDIVSAAMPALSSDSWANTA